MKVDADLVRQAREQRAWSQEHLAQVAGIGLRTLQRIESSGSSSLESAKALAAVLDLPIENLAVVSPKDAKPKKQRLIPSLVAATLTIPLIVAHFAAAETVLLDIGANINAGDLLSQTTTAETGQIVEIEFQDRLKASIKPDVVQIDDRDIVTLALEVFERQQDGRYELLESPLLVHHPGGSWVVRLSDTPAGNQYRLVLSAKPAQ